MKRIDRVLENAKNILQRRCFRNFFVNLRANKKTDEKKRTIVLSSTQCWSWLLRSRHLSHHPCGEWTENGHKAENGHKDGNGRKAPVVPLVLTPLGEVVREAWLQIPVRSHTHGNKVVVHACVCMPDHFHGFIEVLEPMQWSLGDIIQAFKAFCTSSWQWLQSLP